MKKAWMSAGVCVLLVGSVALVGQAQGPAAGAGRDLTGQWQGTLQQGQGQRQVLKITKDGAHYKGMLYSIDQGSRTMAIPAISVDGNSVRFELKQVNAAYEGTLSADGNSIAGNAKMANGEMRALNLVRASGDAAWAIPDPPKPMPADAKPKFDVLTIKPSDPNRPGMLVTIDGRRLKTINTPVSILIAFAYGIQQKQIVNGPAWMEEKFDIDGVPDVQGSPNGQQMRMLVADALVQRFGLKFHYDERELPVYALTVAKGGPKLTVTADAPSAPGNFLYSAPGRLHVTNNTMKDFCKGMQESTMDKPVVDQTGLTERYDFQLNWTPDQSQFGGRVRPPAQDDPNAPPSLYTALQEQLGLKLESTKANVEAFVVDQLQKPGDN